MTTAPSGKFLLKFLVLILGATLSFVAFMCSSQNAGEITKSLADKLSNALDFTGGTEVINQTKPTEHAGDPVNYPQVTALDMPSELPIGDFTATITFQYGGSISDITGAILYIDKSGNYWQVAATPFLSEEAAGKKLSADGVATYMMILKGKFTGGIGEGFGKTFIFEVAVAKTGWQVGNYYNKNVSPQDQPEDAGVDAGIDAGRDAGGDAGIDGGQDAGVDAGEDAGMDASVDAGTKDGGVFDGGPDYCKTSQCFSVPPTGQTMCYDNYGPLNGDGGCPSLSDRDAGFWGQDAMFKKTRTLSCSGGPCSPSAAQEGEIITDSVTGLIWQRYLPATYSGCVAGSACTWQEALNYCDSLIYGGHDDWYLPNPMELTGIVDNQKSDPAIDTTVFPGTPSTFFWSSSSSVNITGNAWNVRFSLGGVFGDSKTSSSNARCVRLGP